MKYIDEAGENQEKVYNNERREVVYNVAVRVMIRVHQLSNAVKGINAKLWQKWDKSHVIKEVKDPNVYILDEDGMGRKVTKAHESQVVRYIPPRNAAKSGGSPY